MADLIDRQTLAEEIERLTVTVAGKSARWYDAKHSVLRIIAEQPTIDPASLRPKGEWISVEDRLPETMDDVLCWYEYFRFGEYQRMFQKFGVGCCIHGSWGGEVAQGHMARVLYWMPLPEPPNCGAKMKEATCE